MANLSRIHDPNIREAAISTSAGDIIAIYDDDLDEVYPFEVVAVKELTEHGFLYGLIYPPKRKAWKETVANKWNIIEWEALEDDGDVVFSSAIPEQAREMIKAIFKYLG